MQLVACWRVVDLYSMPWLDGMDGVMLVVAVHPWQLYQYLYLLVATGGLEHFQD